MKVRVLKRGSRYYPQVKRWYGWAFISDRALEYGVVSYTMEVPAIGYAQSYVNSKSKPKPDTKDEVIWQNYDDTEEYTNSGF